MEVTNRDARIPAKNHMDLHLWQIEMFKGDPMLTLEKLPNLTIIEIAGYDGKKLTCKASGFPCVEILQLFHCVIKELQMDGGGMPVLRGLNVPKNVRTHTLK